MLLYLLFWTILGFIVHFYIIFGTNLLTGGPAQNCCFCLFQCFEETECQMESKRNETFGNVILSSNVIQETWTLLQEVTEAVTRVEGVPPGRAPYLVGPSELHRRTPSSYIYTYVSPNNQNKSQKRNSTAATFCIYEIPSWGLFRSSAGVGIHHGGLLHQHHSPSDEV